MTSANRITFRRPRRRQAGLTIVEVMVSLTVSLVLLTGVVQMYVGTKTSYRMTEELSRIQENGRFALDMLSRDIRMADFWGCMANLADSKITNNLDNQSPDYNADLHEFKESIIGTDDPTGDTLRLGGAFGRNINVNPPFGPTPSANVLVNDTTGIEAGDIILVSDCSAGDIFQVTGNPQGNAVVHNTGSGEVPGNYNAANPTCPGANAHCLSKVYQGDAQIYDVRNFTYSIQKNADGVSGLYRNDVEMVRDVENMQLLYGIDRVGGDRSPDIYLPAASMNASDWARVITIRVGLLIRSGTIVHTKDVDQDHKVADANYVYKDRFLRKTYTSTVTIRNRTR